MNSHFSAHFTMKLLASKSVQNTFSPCILGGIRSLSKTSVVLHKHPLSSGSSAEELSHFNALASSWWDVNGPQRILHKMNLLRMDFVTSAIRDHLDLNEGIKNPDEQIYVPPYNVDLLPENIKDTIVGEQEDKRDEILMQNKLKVLDIGCGGGLFSESMARLPYVESVKGIDLSVDVLEAAKVHLNKDPMLKSKLHYKLLSVEELPKKEKFDVVGVFEMLEHVDYPGKVLSEALSKVKPNGWLFLSTINRDFVSWFTTILMGEHILRIVPVGTHTLSKYINHHEIEDWVEENEGKFKVMSSKGCIYLPAYGWKFTESENVGNYFMAIKRVK